MKVCLDVLLNTDEDIHVNTKILSSITSYFLDFHCLTVNLTSTFTNLHREISSFNLS